MIVGVNRFVSDSEDDVELLEVDNQTVRESQIARLRRVRENRSDERCRNALDQLRCRAESGEWGLLELSVEAARARATVGEITGVLHEVFGQHRAVPQAISGVYRNQIASEEEMANIRRKVDDFVKSHHRRPRALIAKVGQDGHDRGAKVIATAYADFGFEVEIGALFQTPAEVVRQAVDNDVHLVGISTQAGGHKTLVPQVVEGLKQEGAENVVVICGGVVPPDDIRVLEDQGVSAVYGPGTRILDTIPQVLDMIENSLHSN